MIVRDAVHLDRPVRSVAPRLLEGGVPALQAAATAAVAEAERLRVRLTSPHAAPAVHLDIDVELGDPLPRGEVVGAAVTWTVRGLPGAPPMLRGQIELAPEEGGAELRILCAYAPPFGMNAWALDERLLRHIAEASLRRFLHEIRARLTSGGGGGARLSARAA